jgi:hypothetical protein
VEAPAGRALVIAQLAAAASPPCRATLAPAAPAQNANPHVRTAPDRFSASSSRRPARHGPLARARGRGLRRAPDAAARVAPCPTFECEATLGVPSLLAGRAPAVGQRACAQIAREHGGSHQRRAAALRA